MDKIRVILLSLLLCLSLPLYADEAININTADQSALMSIKGVGEKRAQAIIAFRKEHGPFASVEDLSRVQGIGASTVEQNRDRLTVGN